MHGKGVPAMSDWRKKLTEAFNKHDQQGEASNTKRGELIKFMTVVKEAFEELRVEFEKRGEVEIDTSKPLSATFSYKGPGQEQFVYTVEGRESPSIGWRDIRLHISQDGNTKINKTSHEPNANRWFYLQHDKDEFIENFVNDYHDPNRL
jgi:hypothetical protein